MTPLEIILACLLIVAVIYAAWLRYDRSIERKEFEDQIEWVASVVKGLNKTVVMLNQDVAHFRDHFNEVGTKLTDFRHRAKKLNLGDTRDDGEFRFNDEPDPPKNVSPRPHWERPPVDSFAP